MSSVREQLVQRRLDRMRLGQAVCAYVTLPSDPEIRFALVPLSDAEAENALVLAAQMDVPDNVAGLMARDHRQKIELLASSVRDPEKLDNRLYRDGNELQQELEEGDVNALYDEYLEMSEKSNPSMEGIAPEEFDELKKVLLEIPWNDLSGRSWFAAKRFLGALYQDGLLRANSLGSISTTKLTTTND